MTRTRDSIADRLVDWVVCHDFASTLIGSARRKATADTIISITSSRRSYDIVGKHSHNQVAMLLKLQVLAAVAAKRLRIVEMVVPIDFDGKL